MDILLPIILSQRGCRDSSPQQISITLDTIINNLHSKGLEDDQSQVTLTHENSVISSKNAFVAFILDKGQETYYTSIPMLSSELCNITSRQKWFGFGKCAQTKQESYKGWYDKNFTQHWLSTELFEHPQEPSKNGMSAET